MKILIADDKLHIRRVLRRLIEGHEGWEVCAEAEDGVEAVNRAKQFKPDLVVLDLAMPELNGFEAAAQISKALPDVPILMFTLFASPQVEKEAEKVGVQRVISKSTGYMLVPAIEEFLADLRTSSRFVFLYSLRGKRVCATTRCNEAGVVPSLIRAAGLLAIEEEAVPNPRFVLDNLLWPWYRQKVRRRLLPCEAYPFCVRR